MADAIFISYRRDDSEGEAGRLFDDLTRAFGNDAVFMDVTGIKPGVDFRHAIEDNVASCGVLLAVVGRTWATITNQDGVRRLEDPADFVALEIASALKREVPVIPILVHDAKMPAVDLLPENLKSFAYHNSVELTHTRWSSDVALLIEALKQYVTPKTETPVHATVPVQLPAPHHPTGTAAPAAAKNWLPILIGALAGVLLIVVIIAYFLFKPGPDTKSADATPAAAPTAQTPASDTPASSSAPAPSPDTSNVPSSASTSTPAVPPAAKSPSPASSPAPAPSPAAALDPTTPFIGTWKLSGASTISGDALGELVITNSSGSLTVHAYGNCQGPACDWGQQPGAVNNGSLSATFTPSPSGSDTSRTAVITAQLTSAGLDVLIRNTFQSPAGARKSSGHRLLTSAQ